MFSFLSQVVSVSEVTSEGKQGGKGNSHKPYFGNATTYSASIRTLPHIWRRGEVATRAMYQPGIWKEELLHCFLLCSSDQVREAASCLKML